MRSFLKGGLLLGFDCFFFLMTVQVQASETQKWEEALSQSIAEFEDLGGYDTSQKVSAGFEQTTWQGMDQAVEIKADGSAKINVAKARPSFCSSAVYLAFLNGMQKYVTGHNVRLSSHSWENLKPYTIDGSKYPVQADGVGAWGRANANGPGFAVLIHQLKMGNNYYVGLENEYSSARARDRAFEKARKLDVMKIFWNDKIGKDERGHLVIYLGRTKNVTDADGNTDNYIYYWSSNGSNTDINGGYSIKKSKESTIKRAIFTRITHPQKINNVEKISPEDKDQFLSDIGGKRNASVAEVKKEIGVR